MKIPSKKMMKKIHWVNRYFKRINKLFDETHKKWLEISIRFYGSSKHIELTEFKNKIHLRMRVLVRYSSILTNKAMLQLQLEMSNIFKVGKPIPSLWLHMEFDFNDTTKYLGGVVIPNHKEADRLEKKYNS